MSKARDIADLNVTILDSVEASADVTDATNVTSAGALMDSELTSIASVKALNQGVATTDSPTFVAVTATVANANPKLKAAYNASNYIGISHEKINVHAILSDQFLTQSIFRFHE